MNEAENGKSGRDYPKKLKNELEQVYFEFNIEWAKKKHVWGLDTDRSVVRVISEAIKGILLQDPDGEDDGTSRRDYTTMLKDAQLILENPLIYIQNVCRTSERVAPAGSLIVREGGVDQQEATALIDSALTLSQHTREDFENLLQIMEFAKEGERVLKRSNLEPVTVDLQPTNVSIDNVKGQVDGMMKKIKPNDDFEDRRN